MKHIFIGDVHGKVEAVEAALAKEGKKIFVGDFIDSFDRSTADHKKCYDLVFDAIDKGEAEAIYGNHELSYILQDRHRCSGWNGERQLLMTHYGKMIQDRFKPYILLKPDFLVSHAGLTNQLWNKGTLTLRSLPEYLEKWWPDVSSPMHFIGKYRGGWDSVGGLFWCDFNAEFEPIPGLTQVFGHTRSIGRRFLQEGIRRIEDSYCIDCLDRKLEFLEMDV